MIHEQTPHVVSRTTPFRRLFQPLIAAAILVLTVRALPAQAPDPLVVESKAVQTAVLDPAKWTNAILSERYFDALRPLLCRFPGIADDLYAKLKDGYAIDKAALVLEWVKQEGPGPERGRHGWGAEDEYAKKPGQWHALARGLLKPWDAATTNTAPTGDAYVNGLGFWSHMGARGDGQDRLPSVFGPVPLHATAPIGAIDITALLSDAGYGKTLAERLRALEEKGLQVTKQELFDPQYNGQEGEWFDVYSWRTGIGCMKIWVKEPKLVVTFKKGAVKDLGALPAPMEFGKLVGQLKPNPEGQSSMTPPAHWADKVKAFTEKPAGMPDWQWQRLQELHKLGGWDLGRMDVGPLLSSDPAAYAKIGRYLEDWPHYWVGHLTSDYALVPNAFKELLPPALWDHLAVYWEAWLHPETADCENPRLRSYFRQYNWTLGTQNFNFNSIAGGYLASQAFGYTNALTDAQYGVENIMLRLFQFYNGANQEVGDTYYQALSVAAVQMVAKYAQDPLYRLMARIASEKQLEQLVSMYNPNLKRITHPMGRGELKYQCAMQDGPYFALHTLSPAGVLMDLDQPYGQEKFKIPLFGHEGPPARMALLAPWADDHWAHVVDGKALPWQSTARWWHMMPDNEIAAEWHVNYLARHYSLASRSEDGNPVTHVTAQWRRQNAPVTRMEDLSTLQLSFGANARVEQAMASWGIVHHQNKLIALKALPPKGFLTFPPNPDYAGGWRAKDEARGKDAFNALNASAIIMTFGDVSQREVWIGDRKADKISGASSAPIEDPKYQFEEHLRTTGTNSVFAKAGDLITIKDGVSYVALIPLAFNALPRDEEVEVAYEWPILYIHAFLYRGAEAISQEKWYGAEKKATAGFVIELGDEGEYGSFEKFRAHMKQATLKAQWNDAANQADLEYKSGTNSIAMGFRPWVMPQWNVFTDTASAPVSRSVNGQWPYLPEGIQRDTPWSLQGFTGRLEKNGTVLESEAGFRAFLLAEPQSGIVTAYNPLPDPVFWKLSLPDSATVAADGRVGLLRVQADPKANTLAIDHQLKPDQKGRADLASAFVLTGFKSEPKVMLNGLPPKSLASAEVAGQKAWIVPLADTTDVKSVAERLKVATDKWAQVTASRAQKTFFRDWNIIGPFPNGGYAGQFFQLKDFGPEKGFDPAATYKGIKPGEKAPEETDVKWKPLLKPGEAALSDQPLELRGTFKPDCGVMAYAAATIVSDADRTVQLLTGGDERLGIWLNGERVVFNKGFRMATRDQDRVFVKLKKGDNPVLLKLSHGYEGWRLFFRLADAWGLPLSGGVQFKGATGVTPAGGAAAP